MVSGGIINDDGVCGKGLAVQRWRGLAILACAVVAVGMLIAPAAAHATPSPSSIEKQIDAQWNKLEPVIEQYNDVHNQLLKNRAQLKKIDKRLAPLELQVNLAMSQVGNMAGRGVKAADGLVVLNV